MKRALYPLWVMLLTFAVAGCAMTGSRRSAAEGRRAFASLQAAVAEASESAKNTVALIELKGPGITGEQKYVMSGGSLRAAAERGSKTETGLVLTTNGYAVIASTINPDDVARIEAWIGDNKYRARLVKSDSQLGMTVIKIDTDEPIKAFALDKAEDPLTGDWCVSVQPSGEEYDYEQFTSIALCRGQTAGRYREFLLDNAGGISEGSPVLALSGNVIGIVHKRGRVLAMTDLREDLLALLNEAAGVKSADEEAKQKGWFGALVEAINKDYARKYGLSKSCLWVSYVMKDGPAEVAGVKTGDLITSVNGNEMRLSGDRAYQFFLKALHPKVGQPFSLTVLREGDVVELAGIFTKQPEKESVRAADLGVTVRNIEDGDVVTENLFAREGVLVTDIKKGSAASVGNSMRSGLLNKGDIITAIGGTPTPDLDTFSTVLEKLRRERTEILLITYLRGRATGFAALNLKIGEKGNDGRGHS